MLAILALSSLALEKRLTLMACPTHTLRRCSSCHLFSSCAMYHGESISLLVQRVTGGDAFGSQSFAFGNLGLGAREARAFLASGVLTIAADPVGAESGLTPMAGAMDPHADLLLHSRQCYCGRHSPLSWLQCQSILCEKSASLLFLDSVALFGRRSASWFAGSGNGPVFLDDLGDASRD